MVLRGRVSVCFARARTGVGLTTMLKDERGEVKKRGLLCASALVEGGLDLGVEGMEFG